MINLENEIKCVLQLIKNNGYEAHLVGGYVRDRLLEKQSYDIDITTNATPDILKNLFKEYKLNEEFIKFGSVKFQIDKYYFEITTYRKESEYKDHRKPNKIEYTASLKEDLIRRDFTINSICYDGENIIDLFRGIDDLDNKVIRTIGDPLVRFEEDALRILRAMRFSSKLGFEIDSITDLAIRLKYKNLEEISKFSLLRELYGILEGSNYMSVLKKYRLELMEIFSLSKLNLALFNEMMGFEEKQALFFYYSKEMVTNKYLTYKDMIFINDKIDLKYKLKKYGYENIYNILYFRNKYLNIDKDAYLLLKEIEKNKECYSLKSLEIKGSDLLELNIKGDKIGKHLEELLDTVIVNKCPNKREELIKYLKNNIIE